MATFESSLSLSLLFSWPWMSYEELFNEVLLNNDKGLMVGYVRICDKLS
jgi:hypothetical protein